MKAVVGSAAVEVVDTSAASASTNTTEEEKEETVLLDENLMELTGGRPLPLTDRAKALFHMSITNDTLFLSLLNIVDYSLLVGLDEAKNELVVGVIDYCRQYDIIKQLE